MYACMYVCSTQTDLFGVNAVFEQWVGMSAYVCVCVCHSTYVCACVCVRVCVPTASARRRAEQHAQSRRVSADSPHDLHSLEGRVRGGRNAGTICVYTIMTTRVFSPIDHSNNVNQRYSRHVQVWTAAYNAAGEKSWVIWWDYRHRFGNGERNPVIHEQIGGIHG